MSLFGSGRNEKMLKEAMKHAKPERKRISCPKCGKQYTVMFLSSNDSKTCTCGFRIYNS